MSVPDIAASKDEWWQFRGSALAQGFQSIDALPLRLRDATIGTLNLLHSDPGAAPEDTILAAQAIADVATIGILHERTLRESAILSEQLQAALNSRIVIEQAKGVISHTRGVSIDDAFTLMRAVRPVAQHGAQHRRRPDRRPQPAALTLAHTITSS